MRVKTPPKFELHQLAKKLAAAPPNMAAVVGRWGYLHWDEVVHRSLPGGISHEAAWAYVKLMRMPGQQFLPIVDTSGKPFSYSATAEVMRGVHWLDRSLAGRRPSVEARIPEGSRQTYVVSSLMEEAIASSQIEGAATTRVVAKDMLRKGRAPRSTGERMIFNNYKTIEALGEWSQHPLTLDRINEIHASMTSGTLEDPADEGRVRTRDDIVVQDSADGEVAHHPPPAASIQERLEALCAFANAGAEADESSGFVHPAIRAVVLHFGLAYVHPYVDGNGRTARALFYWSMLNQGNDLFHYLSISRVIRGSKRQYERAYLYTETDDGDLTYFILYHMKVIRKALEELEGYIERKSREFRDVLVRVRGVPGLNHRQVELLQDALRHPTKQYTIREHQRSHQVVFQTARTDLFGLERLGLLSVQKIGRVYYFSPVHDLPSRLETVAPPRS